MLGSAFSFFHKTFRNRAILVFAVTVVASGIMMPSYGQTIFNCSSGFSSSGACGVSGVSGGGSGTPFAVVGTSSGTTPNLSNGTVDLLTAGANHAALSMNYQAAPVNVEAFTAMLGLRNDSRRSAGVQLRISQLSTELEGNLKSIRDELQGLRYPFLHAREELTIVDFARSDIPATNKLEALFNNCNCHLSRLLPFYQRVLARLTFIATKVEEQI